MRELTFSDMQEQLNLADMSGYPMLRISVLRNIIIDPINVCWRYHLYNMGFNAEVTFGAYDQVFQEAVGPEGETLSSDTDLIFVFLKLETLNWKIARDFAALDEQQIQDEVIRIQQFIADVMAGIRRQTKGAILWHSFELPPYPAWGVYDSQHRGGQEGVILELNNFLRESLKTASDAYYVDINLPLKRVGAKNFYDPDYWHLGKAPFSGEALSEIAIEDVKFIRSLKNKTKKCLVMDCDNILWGGIIGEDGPEGIQLGRTAPGAAFYEFQQEVLNLYHRGIILALCSKNNEEDVWAVFRDHPEMLLKEDHIAAAAINWKDKASNLRQLAADLNIGLDSMVFVDDSDFEINLVQECLPEVHVIHLPSETASINRDVLASCGLFDQLVFSKEDKARGRMYKAEVARKDLRAQTTDIDDYLKSLEMVLEVRFADDFSIDRIAQLTQRTNQFNLTTKRYGREDILQFKQRKDADIFYVKLKDRFGDSGIIGACILKYEGETALIDSFLLSCRVLGRGVEDVLIDQILSLAGQRHCREVLGEYRATPKNGQARDFYEKHGFTRTAQDNFEGSRFFNFDLKKRKPAGKNYFRSILSDLEAT